jgi:hypothetical protein
MGMLQAPADTPPRGGGNNPQLGPEEKFALFIGILAPDRSA